MARIRTIKPEFWEDEKIASLPMSCRLFFIGTWNLADDGGVFRANPTILKSKIFPYDDIRVSEISNWLNALVKARMILPISHSGESYYVIRTFRDHQKFDARYPNYLIPKEILDEILDVKTSPEENPACTRRAHVEHPPREGEGEREGIGNNNLPKKVSFPDSEIRFKKADEAINGALLNFPNVTQKVVHALKDWLHVWLDKGTGRTVSVIGLTPKIRSLSEMITKYGEDKTVEAIKSSEGYERIYEPGHDFSNRVEIPKGKNQEPNAEELKKYK